MKIFGENLRAARVRLGMSREWLEHECDVPRGSVGRWEDGTREPWVEELRQLRQILGISIDTLVCGTFGGAETDNPLASSRRTPSLPGYRLEKYPLTRESAKRKRPVPRKQ